MDETKLIPEALQELREFLDEQGWEYCLIGGLAAGRWGEARFTHDIDVVVRSAFGDEEDFIKPLLKKFKKRIADAAQFAKAVRTVLVMAGNGVGIDISLGALAFEEAMLSRARPTRIMAGVEFRTARPEDIVVMKSIAGWLTDLAELWTEVDALGNFETALKTVAERIKRQPAMSRPRRKKGE